LALLGIKPLKLLVLGFSLPDAMFSGLGDGALTRYWQHTLTKAVAAREISESFWKQPGDEPFIAGLLQDLGMLVLLQDLKEPYAKFLETVHEKGGNLHDLEIRSLGFNHTQLSARLLETWKLPASLVATIPAVCSPESLVDADEPLKSVRQILHLAEIVATLLCDGHGDQLTELLDTGGKYCRLSRANIDRLIDSLQAKVGQLADVLSLQLPEGMDYRDVLLQAHAQLSCVASDAAEETVAATARGSAADDGGQSLLEHVEALSEAAAQAAGRGAAGFDSPAPMDRVDMSAARTEEVGIAVDVAVQAVSAAVVAEPVFGAELHRAVLAAGSVCRQQRCELSLLLVEIDDFDLLASTRGPRFARQVSRSIRAACQGLDHAGAVTIALDPLRTAIVLPDCERSHAVQYGELLVRSAPALFGTNDSRTDSAVTLSVGAATLSLPPKNFTPDALLERTERCLYGAGASGGNAVKSIEII
jgi:GGDEF domain-containing protein